VDFRLSDDQRALQMGVRRYCAERHPLERVRAAHQDLPAQWSQLGDLGVFSLHLDPADGGAGAGMAEAVIVFEELGAALIPGPLIGTYLAAGLVDGAAEGQAIVGIVDGAAAPPFLVEHLDVLDGLLLLDGGDLFDVQMQDLQVIARPTSVDPLTPIGQVATWPAKRTPLTGGEEVLTGAVLLTSGLQVGIGRAVLEQVVGYLMERHQFGVPVGSFQALKHLAADMHVRVETARAALHAAAVTFDAPAIGDARAAAHAAKILADSAASENCAAAVQMFGGVGFTWDLDVHFYLKRAWVHALSFGDADQHAFDLATLQASPEN
jgi:alkylation response protein AidB-like acyl-CoA dehydrogenase